MKKAMIKSKIKNKLNHNDSHFILIKKSEMPIIECQWNATVFPFYDLIKCN